VIFADVKLQSGDDPKKLKKLGLSLVSQGLFTGRQPSHAHGPLLRQPCAAFDQHLCRIYADRPRHCREFECLLLQNVMAGRISTERALKTIQTTSELAARVDRLLQLLGDTDASLPLSTRFHQTGTRLEAVGLDKETADTYGELTVAMHDLNFLLSDSFYPG
jgi:Fe-S-cluster containining protein